MHATLLTVLLLLSTSTLLQAASLVKEYSGSTFFDDWTFIDAPDTTTHGQVQYTSQSTGLAYVNSGGQAVIGMDDTSSLGAGALRNSVRITSNDVYNIGSLVVADFSHLPYGCSTWPAYWMVGPNWPYGGEIDIVEGVHDNKFNQMTLHTASGCNHDNSQPEYGNIQQTSCDSTGSNNNGCGVIDSSDQFYGSAFSNAGGGVFAMALTDAGVSIWRWTRANVPADIKSGNPDYSSWGVPGATWVASSCSPQTYFKDLSIVFDLTACGDWAGQADVWAASSCSASYSSCSAAVSDAANFQNAYFETNYIKVYSV